MKALLVAIALLVQTMDIGDVLDLAGNYGAQIGYANTIQAIVLVESSANPNTPNGISGEIGLMQIKPRTAHYVSKLNPKVLPIFSDYETYKQALRDPDYNLQVGSLYFKRCMDIFKSWPKAVVCYNQGVAGTKRLSPDEIAKHPYLKKVIAAVTWLGKRYAT